MQTTMILKARRRRTLALNFLKAVQAIEAVAAPRYYGKLNSFCEARATAPASSVVPFPVRHKAAQPLDLAA